MDNKHKKEFVQISEGSITKIIDKSDINMAEVRTSDGKMISMLADVEQSINGVKSYTRSGILEMIEEKNNSDYQLNLCIQMMKDGDILPAPFERAVVLLRKQKRYDEELEICLYVKEWCENCEKNWGDRRGWQPWSSPKLQKCIQRIPKTQALIKNNTLETNI